MEKIALITGASSGIGKELAEIFAKNGYSLLLIARNTVALQQLQNNLKNKYQCQSQILSVDLTQPNSVDIIMNTFKHEMKKIEVLVNNAGYGFAKKFTDISLADTIGMIEVNMSALTKLTHGILPYMVAKKEGKILNVASTAAYAPGPYMAVYYASKAYVLSLSQAIDEEYRKEGITVSTLCPGPTKTAFMQRAGLDKTFLASGILPMMTAEQVANIAYKGLMKKKRVIIAGVMNKITAYSMIFSPTWLVMKITALLEKPKPTVKQEK